MESYSPNLRAAVGFPEMFFGFLRAFNDVFDVLVFQGWEDLSDLSLKKTLVFFPQYNCPIIVFFVASYRPHLSHFLEKCSFCDPN